MWETEILSQNAVFCCMYNFISQCCLSGCETLHTSALKNISILDISMSSSLSRLDPDNAHTLWHDKQFQWFVAVGAFGLLIALTEAIRWVMVIIKVDILKNYLFRVIYVTVKEEIDEKNKQSPQGEVLNPVVL